MKLLNETRKQWGERKRFEISMSEYYKQRMTSAPGAAYMTLVPFVFCALIVLCVIGARATK